MVEAPPEAIPVPVADPAPGSRNPFSVAGFRLPEVPVGDSSGEYPVLPAENGSATPSGRPRRVSGLTG